MQSVKKLCAGCNQEQYIWKSHERLKYCKYCWQKHKDNPVKNIKQVSDKKKLLDKEYSQLRRIFLNNHPKCEMHIPGICQNDATDVHHKSLRGENYLKVSTWMSACRACHDYTHLNPDVARDLGFIDTKY